MDYVKISFGGRKNDLIRFGTEHDTKPMGCSSWVEPECMDNHYFLSEFYSCMYFFTLKPETWIDDLKSEVHRLSKRKKEYHQKEILEFQHNVADFIKANKNKVI